MASFQSWWSLQLVNYLRFGVIVGSLSEILDGLSKLKGLNLGALDSLLKKKHENYWPQTKIKKKKYQMTWNANWTWLANVASASAADWADWAAWVIFEMPKNTKFSYSQAY